MTGKALAFGYRMAEHPGVRLKIFRFIKGPIKDHLTISMPETMANNMTMMPIEISLMALRHFLGLYHSRKDTHTRGIVISW